MGLFLGSIGEITAGGGDLIQISIGEVTIPKVRVYERATSDVCQTEIPTGGIDSIKRGKPHGCPLKWNVL